MARGRVLRGDGPLHEGRVPAARRDEAAVVGQEVQAGHLRAVPAHSVVQRLKDAQNVRLKQPYGSNAH